MAFEKPTLADYILALSDTLTTMSDALDKSVRLGKDIDKPEGVRYVVFSDTLVTKWSQYFRGIASQLGGTHGTTTTEQHMVRGGEEEQGEQRQPDAGSEAGSADAVAGGEPDPVL